VRLLVITHVHYDHVMGLKAIAEMCACPVAVHQAEAEDLAQGRMVIPPGHTFWARLVSWLGRTIQPAMTAFEPHEAEIVVGDQMSLDQYGLDGRLVATPGHSPGSMSLILEDGQALVGDTVFNPYPFNLGPIMPPFYSDRERLLQTWEHLISLGLKKFFPGHGPALDLERLTKIYLRYAQVGTRPQ
jgi:hydroxyacylglutathione hydrolase